MISFRDRRFTIAALALLAIVLFLLPSFVGYRYTAPEHRNQFVSRPWQGWSFVYSALAVPAASKLKTSGMALRKAEWLFRGTAIDPQEVQLIFAAAGAPYTLTQSIEGRQITSTVTPSYDFLWQVRGDLTALSGTPSVVVALLDYETGRALYDVRGDLVPQELEATTSPGAPTVP
jgi:hypothetical protein